jgi:ABC-type cobalamin/Fe3+-siderophores transport system ATPase subunit
MHEDRPAGENPFCTRRIRPGVVAYCFPAGVSVEDLVDRLCINHWRGQIVGPHGSGKSTLLARILGAIEQAGRQAVLFELHDGQRRLPGDWRCKIELSSLPAPAIIVVDGYEQLGIWSRFLLKRYCSRRHFGLLVTSHVSVGLPEIYYTSTSLEMAKQIVEQLMQNERMTFSADVIAGLFARHSGNIRELLFDLYDLFEQKMQDEN